MTDISRRGFLVAGLALPVASIVGEAAAADAAQVRGIELNTAWIGQQRDRPTRTTAVRFRLEVQARAWNRTDKRSRVRLRSERFFEDGCISSFARRLR